MKLNIYQVSHPVVKILSTNISEQKQEYNYKYIGFLLIYEIFRKQVDITQIYIKTIKNVKRFELINQNRKLLILTNISNTYDILGDIKIIMPQLNILHINYDNVQDIENSIHNLKIDNTKIKIFVIEKLIEHSKILNLVKYLNTNKYINIENISIGCVVSTEKILNQIARQYPQLKIYTTKIIDNKNIII
uniref:Uracil phosphoribosyltransferase n=1 Tax=Pleurostichidium falkenbergii TaxID=121064 RepID=A0A4D6UY07_9FLOR|nr:Uracil phosphoribosyltransferase [Pleurostichidium falkenbergii]QCH39756.1 Uracil phosphoribosyltransferase [Pleurostichidium falkenbergii]